MGKNISYSQNKLKNLRGNQKDRYFPKKKKIPKPLKIQHIKLMNNNLKKLEALL